MKERPSVGKPLCWISGQQRMTNSKSNENHSDLRIEIEQLSFIYTNKKLNCHLFGDKHISTHHLMHLELHQRLVLLQERQHHEEFMCGLTGSTKWQLALTSSTTTARPRRFPFEHLPSSEGQRISPGREKTSLGQTQVPAESFPAK